MSELSKREQSLVALGAAIAANCIPCVEFHVPEAQKAGLDEREIKEALEIADKVRRVPAGMVMQSALARIDARSPRAAESNDTGCGCGASSETGCGG